MTDDAGTAARRELLVNIRETLKAIRLLKSELPIQHAAVPAGTMQVLASIAALSPGTGSGCHLKDLAVRCSLDPSTVSRSVAALVRSGLVIREPDPADGRASVLAPTAHGRASLDAAVGWADHRLAETLRQWNSEDILAFNALMRRFATDLMTHHDHPLEAAR